MNDLFTLEFNEDQQMFHHNYGKSKHNTHGWFTVTDFCSDRESRIFEAYVNRIKKKKLTKYYVLRSFQEISGFISNLIEYNLSINESN